MFARLERHPLSLLALGVAALSAVAGVLAGLDPKYGLGFALGLAFLLVALSNVAVGVCLMGALAILDAQGVLGVAKPAGAVLALSWLAAIASRRIARGTFAENHALMSYGLILFAGWVAVSMLWAEDKAEAVTALTRYVPNILLIPIVFDAIQRRRQMRWLLATIVGSAALAAILGILQPPADPSVADQVGRAAGTFGDANQFAAALVAAMGIAGAFALARDIGAGWRLAAVGAAGICLLAVFLTLSRGGLVAIAAALATTILVGGRWRARALVAAALVLVVSVGYFAVFASLPARERVTNVGGGTGRVDLWTVGGRMLAAHPGVGVGAGNFPVASVHYLLRPGAIERADFIISTPKVAHNTYLQIAAELGIPVAALFVGLIGFSLRCSLSAARRFEREGDIGMELLARGAVVGTAGYLTAMLFISQMYSKLFWMLLALGPTMLALARADAQASGRPVR